MALDKRRHSTVSLVNLIMDADGEKIILDKFVTRLICDATISGGYNIYFDIIDINNQTLLEIFNSFKYNMFDYVKVKPVFITFRFGHSTDDNSKQYWTEWRTAIITNITTDHLMRRDTSFGFTAIDPGTWVLNCGKADGKVYTGRIGTNKGVIYQCMSEYTKDIKVPVGINEGDSNTGGESGTLQNNQNSGGKAGSANPNKASVSSKSFELKVDDTIDNDQNKWYMNRLHPMGFILSMMDWSSSVTKKQTPFIMQSQDNIIKFVEMANLKPGVRHNNIGTSTTKFAKIKVYSSNNNIGLNETLEDSMVINGYPAFCVSANQTRTAGISTVTGKYIDYITNKDDSKVDNLKTSNKKGINLFDNQSFNPCVQEYATFIQPIPEHNNMDVGVKYWKYFDGRARNYFIKLFYNSLIMYFDVIGDVHCDNTFMLGGSSIDFDLSLLNNDRQHFLGGEWLVLGWKHLYSDCFWSTRYYVCRHDKVSGGVSIIS